MVGGLVTIRQRPSTANGTIFLLLEDEFGFINVVVPSKLVGPNEDVVKGATFILVRGKLEKDGGGDQRGGVEVQGAEGGGASASVAELSVTSWAGCASWLGDADIPKAYQSFASLIPQRQAKRTHTLGERDHS